VIPPLYTQKDNVGDKWTNFNWGVYPIPSRRHSNAT
jgi:hypothetical protein